MKSIMDYMGKGNTWFDQQDKPAQATHDELSVLINHCQLSGEQATISASIHDVMRINIIEERLKQAEIMKKWVEVDGTRTYHIITLFQIDDSLYFEIEEDAEELAFHQHPVKKRKFNGRA